MERPPYFTDEPFGAALARAARECRWLLVDVTDATKAACHKIAYTLWREPDLITWIEAKALVVRVDARADVEAAQALDVPADFAPLVLLFRDGKERARFQSWELWFLRSRLEGHEVLEADLALARMMLQGERDVVGRDGLAACALAAGCYDEALVHLDWLWRNMCVIDPGNRSWRLSYTAWDIQSLCRKSWQARAHFQDLRDRAGLEAAQDGDDSEDRGMDWLILNRLLEEESLTVAWVKDLSPEERRSIPNRIATFILPPLLKKRSLRKVAGDVIRDPIPRLQHPFAKGLGSYAVPVYRSLLAVGRDEEAEAFKREVLLLDGSDGMRFALRRSP